MKVSFFGGGGDGGGGGGGVLGRDQGALKAYYKIMRALYCALEDCSKQRP